VGVGPPEVTARVAIAEAAGVDHVERRTRDDAELAEPGDRPGESPIRHRHAHPTLDHDRSFPEPCHGRNLTTGRRARKGRKSLGCRTATA
jgi:hypothetical protein